MKRQMKHTLYTLIVLILLSSCAATTNQPYKKVIVYTTEPSKIIHKYDTISTINNKANLWVERKKEPLSIIATTDSITKTIEIKSNLLPMLFDRNNPKRYSYPKRIYINSADTISKYYRYSQSRNKGDLYLHFSVPYINFFRLKPQNETYKTNTGFMGVTVGLDYYHSNNQFINLGTSYVVDYFPIVTELIDILMGEHESMSSWYVNLTNNHKIGQFTIGYGLSYGINTWAISQYDWDNSTRPKRDPISKSHNAVGLIFPTRFQFGKYVNIGIVYRPTFYRPDMPDKFSYEHLISLDIGWKIKIKK
jgi:hypothetical protein